jgi:hypothetical protein
VLSLLSLPVLNLADALFTRSYLLAGVAHEANPLMRMAWEASPSAFLMVKLSLGSASAVFLWWQRAHTLARRALHLGVSLYTAVVGYHLLFLGTEILSSKPLIP